MSFARKAWSDMQNPHTGVVRFDHDHYLRIWALTEPKILNAVHRLVSENTAHVTVSTAHKAKGRQWGEGQGYSRLHPAP